MKKLLIIFITFFVLIATSTYAQDDTTVFIILEEVKELIPDILSLSVGVNVNTSKEVDAVNILGAVDKSLKNLGFEYRGGKYYVTKNCWWEENKQKCSGYKGSIHYLFELKEPSQQNKIFQELANFKEKYGEKMDFIVSTPEWTVSKKNLRNAEDALKIEIIGNAQNFAKKVSEKMGKTCSLTSIDYDIRRPSWWWKEEEVSYMMKTTKSMVEAPEPKKEEKTVSVKASVKMICR
ncbi:MULTISPECIES: SIMPL domain-containing protein [Thermodesulfovibrio]|jgi:hypothetical protein|uniref:SIMPL domain-containing protein n=1 Tax=Thermodesulfovibrio obliviosus TaxID=3118332 RepID=A0AAU8H454_9BACT